MAEAVHIGQAAKQAGDGLVCMQRFAGGGSERLEITVVKTDGKVSQYRTRFSSMP